MTAAGARVGLALASVLCAAGCLRAWSVDGPYACTSEGTCPSGLSCDEGICCNPEGLPACPTLPSAQGLCGSGAAPTRVFQDRDGDGQGNVNVSRLVCRAATTDGGWVTSSSDCDDANRAVFLGGDEVCDGLDNTCNGVIDEGLSPQTTFFRDDDGDGFGDDGQALMACAAPPGFVTRGGDCQPDDATKFPGAMERCNGVLDDCSRAASQRDLPPLSDAQTLAEAKTRFPCESPGLGVCRAGAITCVSGVRRCTPRLNPGVEVCNGLDDNCDGRVDEAPDCGGPVSFSSPPPGATVGAFRMTGVTFNQLSTRCQKGVANTTPATALGATWSASSSAVDPYHVWYIEAPAGTAWDLSAQDVKLQLDFSATFTAVGGAGGAWSDPANGGSYNPVVYLCGESETQLMRYRITTVNDAFSINDSSFSKTLALNVRSPEFLVGAGSGFDTSKVRRIELVLQANTPSFTITFAPSTGFSR